MAPESQTETDRVPTVDGEPFVPEAAELLFYEDGTYLEREWSADGHRIRVTAQDERGDSVVLVYGLSQVVVGMAEYDDPDPTYTTEPASIERKLAYGGDHDDADPARLQIDGGAWDLDATVLRERAMYVEAEEDYVVAHGNDDADPVPNEYDAYWVLVYGHYQDGDGPFYQHERYDPHTDAMSESDLKQIVKWSIRGGGW